VVRFLKIVLKALLDAAAFKGSHVFHFASPRIPSVSLQTHPPDAPAKSAPHPASGTSRCFPVGRQRVQQAAASVVFSLVTAPAGRSALAARSDAPRRRRRIDPRLVPILPRAHGYRSAWPSQTCAAVSAPGKAVSYTARPPVFVFLGEADEGRYVRVAAVEPLARSTHLSRSPI
jgi:hypothetical protein